MPGWGFSGNGRLVKSNTSTSKNYGLTAEETLKLKADAMTIAENSKNGFTDSKGKPYAPITHPAAVNLMQLHGIPSFIYLPALNSQ